MAKSRPLEFAVIGLGRFGASLGLALIKDGHHVLGIDEDRELVQEYADQLTHTVLADATNEDALRELEVGSYDTVIVAIGQNFEGSVLATASLKNLGAKRVICKALTTRQAEILRRVGADQVVLPEIEAGLLLARQLSRPRLLAAMDQIPGYSVAEVSAPPHMTSKTLAEIDLRRGKGIMVLAVRSNDGMHVAPSGVYPIQDGDVLVVLGTVEDIEAFSKDL